MVCKAVAGQYTVKTEKDIVICSVRGKLKKDFDIFVGDEVTVEENVITSVLPRKNVLIRPYVANIDILFIVLAPIPEPDFVLVEKLLLNCRKEGIEPYIISNKIDMEKSKEMHTFLLPFSSDAKIIYVSAKTKEGFDEIKNVIQDKTVCFAGQSAVGKTSLISAIGGVKLEVGDVSKRINRGKNTTRAVEIFDFAGGKLVDTCGFSVAESIDIKPEELIYYYDDFVAVQSKCRFANCTHIKEPGCAVKEMVQKGTFDENKYNRYVKLFNELTERRKKLYV